MTVLMILIGFVCMLPIWAVGRWVTHLDGHRNVAWDMLAGTLTVGTAAVVAVFLWAVGTTVWRFVAHP